MTTKIEQYLNEFRKVPLSDLTETRFFSRKDSKYIGPINDLENFIRYLPREFQLLMVDNQFVQAYRNEYFDTSDLKLYHDHHNDRSTRKKVRIRSYKNSAKHQLEIKQRSKGKTSKRILPLPAPFLNKSELAWLKDQEISEELNSVLNNEYDRITFIHPETNDRITIDTNLIYNGIKELSHLFIVEYKYEQHQSPSVRDFLKLAPVHSSKVSKYCLGIDKTCSFERLKRNRFKNRHQKIDKLVYA